ncbi:MAG: WGR domain-containing protein [Mesorhizobium sp.]|nr:MAG: WGR domain-containing protein [Mesorhizobium sp.]RWI83755.1 MAG: WGR domain-containing protein [Mesorhizobium sp.]RWJ57716.1 MAG: WGR domain-containing protein [Mesorhizobium sp.]
MNRSGLDDSNVSLDVARGLRDSAYMIAQRYRLYVERRDMDRNMARFYAMSIEETLFGQTCLVRRWGRIGTRGRMVQHSFEAEREAVALFLELVRAKKKRGYRPTLAARHAEAAPSG